MYYIITVIYVFIHIMIAYNLIPWFLIINDYIILHIIHKNIHNFIVKLTDKN